MNIDNSIVGVDEPILLTGATGFIGAKVLQRLQEWGFRNIKCLVRHSSDLSQFYEALHSDCETRAVEFVKGNLLSKQDCNAVTQDVTVIYHLAAGTGTKSFADAYMNSVVTTRNLVEAALQNNCLKRFVNISSFAVYSNKNKPCRNILDETCPTEAHPEQRGDAYCYAKSKQDELVIGYGKTHQLPYVIVRPGVVYGPGKTRIHGRVGLDTFGFFLHLGGSNKIPLTYVDNCAEVIALAGITKGIDGEIFNVVDDDLPTSRNFLRLYKKNVASFRSVYVPRIASYLLCHLWEKYARWSEGQLPPVHNRKEWFACWKRTVYANDKAKTKLHWKQRVPTQIGLHRYFESCGGRK